LAQQHLKFNIAVHVLIL